MHANVVTLRYKSERDVENAVDPLKRLAEKLPGLPGFRSFTLVRVADKETIHVVHFATEEDARHARETMIPRLKEVAGPFLASEPEPRTGDVLHELGPPSAGAGPAGD